jgi:AcrR family transcriptional regulator
MPLAPLPPADNSPRARLLALSAERQAQLLDPAEQDFADHGFAKASLNRILAAAGMSKGQAYYYIADKGDLYAAVLWRAFTRFSHSVQARSGFRLDHLATGTDFWGHTAALFDQISQGLHDDPSLAALARGIYDSAAPAHATAEVLAHLRAQMALWLQRGQSLGSVRDDLPQSLLIGLIFTLGMESDRWFAAQWDQLSATQAQRISRQLVEMARAMLAPPSS